MVMQSFCVYIEIKELILCFLSSIVFIVELCVKFDFGLFASCARSQSGITV